MTKDACLGGYKNTIKYSIICKWLGTINEQTLRLDNTLGTQDELTLDKGKQGLFIHEGGEHR